MWRATTKPSSLRRSLNWYSRSWLGETAAEADTAVSTFSPAKSNAVTAGIGTGQRPGTPPTNTARPSGAATTNSKARKNAPHRTLLMRNCKPCSFRRSISLYRRRLRSLMRLSAQSFRHSTQADWKPCLATLEEELTVVSDLMQKCLRKCPCCPRPGGIPKTLRWAYRSV